MSRIFITGDTHGDFRRIADFTGQYNTTTDDIMIILGDAGINYFGDTRDVNLKRMLSTLPITLFCVHGNHEMRPQKVLRDGGPSYRLIEWFDERFDGFCWQEPEFQNLLFAHDAQVYYIAGKRCIVIGGAYSVDKYYRISRGMRWFDDEQLDDATKSRVQSTLESLENRIDVVLSHTCPLKYVPAEMFLPYIDQSTVDKSTEEWLDMIEDNISYDHWLCGHYHTDKTIDKMRFLFTDIIDLEEYLCR